MNKIIFRVLCGVGTILILFSCANKKKAAQKAAERELFIKDSLEKSRNENKINERRNNYCNVGRRTSI